MFGVAESRRPKELMSTGQRILVIDDDKAVRRTLSIALSSAGYQVIEAKDGKEAMRLWRDQGADLVITDIHMPDKNGLEVIMELRAFSRSIPIIAMTDGGRTKQLGHLGDARLLGAVRTVPKPFRLDEMLATVRATLAP
jgi:DNA-binding response OmpR family regulator